MIEDANSIKNGTIINADICIAGAGAAGITIAREFTSDSTNIVLLEGGPLDPSYINEGGEVYDGATAGLPINISNGVGRIRAFGGTTNHWGGWCAPLERADMSAGGYPPNAEWPLDYEELIPHYKQAQTICDIGGFNYDAEKISSQENKSLLRPEDSQIRNVVYQRVPPSSRSFNKRYRSEIEESGNIDMYYHANLVEILLSKDQERIRRYSCKTFDNISFKVEADQFILALGGLENPRLLLSSTSESPSGVGNNNDQVGRYFMQHPHFNTEAYLILKEFDQSFYQYHDTEIYSDVEQEPLDVTVRGAISLKHNIRRDNNLPNIACTIKKVDTTIDSPIPSRSVANLPEFLPEDMNLYRLVLRAEQKPLKQSRVKLMEQTDRLGIPRIEVDWRIAESDLRKYKQFLKEIGKELSKSELGRIWTRLTEDNKFKYQGIWGGAHHMGTTRMSERPDQGVVDKDCKVHDVSNLYIAGSSVFPTVGYANPTLTIVALAHRLSEHLRGELNA